MVDMRIAGNRLKSPTGLGWPAQVRESLCGTVQMLPVVLPTVLLYLRRTDHEPHRQVSFRKPFSP
jgi:hypothetical protein